MKTQVLIFTALSVMLVGSLNAQWTKSVSVSTGYDDNAFRNYQGLSDYATQVSAYLAKDFDGESWQSRLFYRGSFNLFAEYDERNYHYHQLGAAWSRIISEQGNAFNLGVNGSLRANGQVYNYYNFQEASGYSNVKIRMGSASSANFGYRIRRRWYNNLSELDYLEHYLFARFGYSFQTRTTLTVETKYGRKSYREQVTGEKTWQLGMGGYGHHQGGMGQWGGWNQEENSSQSVKPSVSQWIGQIRVAQSLTNTTGLSTDLILRRNPGNGVRYLAGQVSGYTSEDELFDDPYGYESEELGVTLTQLLPWKVTLKAGGEYKWKDYVNRPALDLNGETLSTDELRTDRQIWTWLSLGKTFQFRSGRTMSLFGEFYRIDNQSNDFYYDYRGNYVSLGIETTF